MIWNKFTHRVMKIYIRFNHIIWFFCFQHIVIAENDVNAYQTLIIPVWETKCQRKFCWIYQNMIILRASISFDISWIAWICDAQNEHRFSNSSTIQPKRHICIWYFWTDAFRTIHYYHHCVWWMKWICQKVSDKSLIPEQKECQSKIIVYGTFKRRLLALLN